MIVLECLFLTMAPIELEFAWDPWKLGSQDAASPMMQGIMDLHHDIFFFLILILVFILRILVHALWHFHYKKNPIPQRIVHGTTIEILRTILMFIVLLVLCQNAVLFSECAGPSGSGPRGTLVPTGPSSSNPLGIDLNFPPADESASTAGLPREVEVVDQELRPLSEAEEKIRFRLSHTPAYNSPKLLSEVREIYHLKGFLVDRMVELDLPFSDFWRERREDIIGDSLLTTNRTEYGSHRLRKMVETLRQADARTSSTFKTLSKIRIKFFQLGSLKC